MILPLWRSNDTGQPAPAIAVQVADAVRAGTAGALFPPLATMEDGYYRHAGYLTGAEGAAQARAALTDPRFEPLTEELQRMDGWCATTAAHHAGWFGPGVLAIGNGELFGPVVRELFTACAAGGLPAPADYCRMRSGQWLDALTEFVDRLKADVDRYRDLPGCQGPVIGLSAHAGETHHQGRRVLRTVFEAGGVLAYKPRPLTGEALFLAAPKDPSTSIFALLNALAETDLPTLWCSPGAGYGWQEWLSPAEVPTDAAAAPQYWRQAGALAAAAFAFGIGDLIEGNLLTGHTTADNSARLYPIDLEVFARPMPRLWRTGLIPDATGQSEHVGLSALPRPSTVDGPVACFLEPDRHLVVVDRPWRTDAAPHEGYAGWLPDLLRGAFDTWAAICRYREEVCSLLPTALPVRVLPHDTGDYWAAWRAQLLTGAAPGSQFTSPEREALLRGDVPYFLSTPGGATLHTLNGVDVVDTGLAVPSDAPSESVAHRDRWTLTEFGVVVRDLIQSCDVSGTSAGVRVTGTEVAIEWPAAERRLIYHWDDTTVRLRVTPLVPPEPPEEIAARLRRIDDIDAAIRTPWAMGGFTDLTAEARLQELTGQAMAWLESVLDTHGWPGPALVGDEAAAGAARLVQHADGPEPLRDRCLAAMTDAAKRGDVPWRDVAYLADSLLLSRGLPQRYGTKFQPVDGQLVPCPIADLRSVDRERTAMGLPTLAEYTEQIRRRFGETIEKG